MNASPDGSECPPRNKLCHYSLGKLTEEELEQIAQHVDDCSDCEETIAGINDEDTLLDGMRFLEPVDTAQDNTALEQVLANLLAGDSAPSVADECLKQVVDTKPTKIRDYVILDKLGEGGMGAVYRALHTRLDRQVALKVLPASRMGDHQAVGRFIREMKAVGKLDHPNIVRAFDAGEDDGVYYLVMELVDGIDLAKLAKRHGQLPVAESCELVRQAALGLEHAHQAHLIHRDVKPSNLILTRGGHVKVLDLGLARLQGLHGPGEEMTSSGQLMGTIDYMAPEQGNDSHQADIRADIYGLGATLYKLLTGRTPFDGPQYDTPLKKMMALATAAVPPVEHSRTDLAVAVSAIVHRMLARNPEERYATPADVADALEPFCANADLPGLFVESRKQAESPTEMSCASASRPNVIPAADAEQPNETHSGALHDLAVRGSDGSEPAIVTAARSLAKNMRRTDGERVSPNRRLRVLYASIGIALALIASVIVFATGEGDLELRIYAEDVTVNIDGKTRRVNITSPRDRIAIRLPAGRHELEVTRDGFTAFTKQFRIIRNGHVEVDAVWKPAAGSGESGAAETRRDTQVLQDRNPSIQPRVDSRVARELAGILPEALADSESRNVQVETVALRTPVRCVAWQPGGSAIAVSDATPLIRLYDNQLNLVRFLSGHEAAVNAVAWSHDGKRIASASDDGTVRLWSIDGALERTLSGHVGSVNDVAWSRDSQWLASGGVDGVIQVWRTDRYDEPVVLNGGMGHPVMHVEWERDIDQLIAGFGNRLELLTFRETALSGHDATVGTWIAWNPSGLTAAVVFGRDVALWGADGKVERSLIRYHNPQPIVLARWTNDGSRLVTWARAPNRLVHVYGSDGTQQAEITCEAGVASVDWNSSGNRLLVGAVDGSLSEWTPDGVRVHLLSGCAHPGLRPTLAPRRGIDQFAVVYDRSVRLVAADGSPQAIIVDHKTPLLGIAWTRDGSRLSTLAPDSVAVWAATDDPASLWREHARLATGAIPPPAAVGPDGSQAVVQSFDGVVELSALDGSSSRSLDGNAQTITAIEWRPDGRGFSTAGIDGTLRFWTAAGEFVAELDGPNELITSLAWSTDNQWLASGNQNGEIHVWTSQGKPAGAFGKHAARITAMEWSSDGARLVTGDAVGGVRIQTPSTPDDAIVFRTASEIVDIQWSPDGQRFAVSNESGEVRVWNADGSGPREMATGRRAVRSIAWSDDSESIIVATDEGIVTAQSVINGQIQWTLVFLSADGAALFNDRGILVKHDRSVAPGQFVHIQSRETPSGSIIEILENQ